MRHNKLFVLFGLLLALLAVAIEVRAENYTVTKKDHQGLISLANRLGVDWEEMAQLNNLKPPYILKVGRSLQIPAQKVAATSFPGVKTSAGIAASIPENKELSETAQVVQRPVPPRPLPKAISGTIDTQKIPSTPTVLHPAPELQTVAQTNETVHGTASWYGKRYHGRKTSYGDRFNMYDHTAAMMPVKYKNKTVRVTRLDTGQSVDVRVNDRGPTAKGRVIDLSWAAAQELGMLKKGLAKVKVEVIT